MSTDTGDTPDVASTGPGDEGFQSSVPSMDDSSLDAIDPGDPRQFGRALHRAVCRLTETGAATSPHEDQLRQAANTFKSFLRASVETLEVDTLSYRVRDALVWANGQKLRLPRRHRGRLRQLREIFSACGIRGFRFDQRLTIRDLVRLLEAIRAGVHEADRQPLSALDAPGLEILKGPPTRPLEEALGEVTVQRYMARVYVRLLVKVRNLHRQLKASGETEVSAETLRRITQTIARTFASGDFTLLRLPPLELSSPGLGSHSVHSSIYGMLLADRLGLPPRIVASLGTAILTQDIDRIHGVKVRASNPPGDAPADSELFRANLRDVARSLERLDTSTASTLRALLVYERACPLDQPLERPFYRRSRSLHAVLRIVDLVRNYDLMVQGLRGRHAHTPDQALDRLRQQAPTRFDPPLVELFTVTLGIYPPGTTVRLTNERPALVLSPPDASTPVDRPRVRLLDDGDPAVLDLGAPEHSPLDIRGSMGSTAVADPNDESGAEDLFILK